MSHSSEIYYLKRDNFKSTKNTPDTYFQGVIQKTFLGGGSTNCDQAVIKKSWGSA